MMTGRRVLFTFVVTETGGLGAKGRVPGRPCDGEAGARRFEPSFG